MSSSAHSKYCAPQGAIAIPHLLQLLVIDLGSRCGSGAIAILAGDGCSFPDVCASVRCARCLHRSHDSSRLRDELPSRVENYEAGRGQENLALGRLVREGKERVEGPVLQSIH